MRKVTYALFVCLLGMGAAQSDAQTSKIQKEVTKKLQEEKKKAAEPQTLEQMIQQALKHNPDIRVAEVKVREAQAERERTRLVVASEVSVLHAGILAAQAAVKEGYERSARAKVLFEKKAIAKEELAAAELTYMKLAADVASLQAKLPYLLGKTEITAKADTAAKLIEEALKNNPDVRVSETKLLTAEAELDRVRIKVAMDVTGLEAEIQEAKSQLKAAEAKLQRVQQLLGSSSISREEFELSVYALERARSALSVKQAKLPYLLGKQPGVISDLIDAHIEMQYFPPALALVMKAKSHLKAITTDEDFLRRVTLDVMGRVPTAAEIEGFLKLPENDRREKWLDQLSRDKIGNVPADCWARSTGTVGCIHCHQMSSGGVLQPAFRVWAGMRHGFSVNVDTPMADKLRKALDAPVRFEYGNTAPKVVIDNLRDKALAGVNLHVRVNTWKKKEISVKLEHPVPMGAVLQYLEDELDIVFILRDYGIVVVGADEKLPPGATRVVDFWKHGKTPEPAAKEKAPATKPRKSSPDGVRGVIEKVDPKDSRLVQISIGSDAGLEKDDVLDVYRLLPQAIYLGNIRVEQVTPNHSVARYTNTNVDAAAFPRVGDQVSSKLTTK